MQGVEHHLLGKLNNPTFSTPCC